MDGNLATQVEQLENNIATMRTNYINDLRVLIDVARKHGEDDTATRAESCLRGLGATPQPAFV